YEGSQQTFVAQRGVSVVRYDGTLTAQTATRTDGNLPTLQGMAVGLFGTPSGGFTTTSDFAPQIGLLVANNPDGNGTSESFVEISNIGAPTYAPSFAAQYVLTDYLQTGAASYTNVGGCRLRAGDLTGASVRVGAPEILRVSDPSGASGQPQLVLSLPPQ